MAYAMHFRRLELNAVIFTAYPISYLCCFLIKKKKITIQWLLLGSSLVWDGRGHLGVNWGSGSSPAPPRPAQISDSSSMYLKVSMVSLGESVPSPLLDALATGRLLLEL